MEEKKFKSNVLNICLKEGNDIQEFTKTLDLEVVKCDLIADIEPQLEAFKTANYAGKKAPKKDKLIKELYDTLPDAQKPMFRIFQMEVPEGTDIEELKAKFNKDARVEFAEPDYLNELLIAPNDPRYGELYGMQKIEAECAWKVTEGDDVVVAVVDTGVDPTHPDLQGNLWSGPGGIFGYDFSDGDPNPSDYHGHGTHVAGTIAAVGNNNEGVIGVAPKAKIMSIKIFPWAYDSVIYQAMTWAADNGAKVLNNSWGPWGRRPSAPMLEAAVNYVYSKGGICIFAAGNKSDQTSYYSPANYNKTIAVASTDRDDEISSFSNYGPTTDVGAPGSNILSTRNGGSYRTMSGTSMACPHVAGLAALILANDPSLSFEEVRDCIKSSADDISTSKPIGAGRINACSAMKVQDNCIAFSASGRDHKSDGADKILKYADVQLNEGTAWDGQNFVAPVSGLYHFGVSFVKNGLHRDGTMDDVRVFISHNRNNVGMAWSMEGSGWTETAAYQVALKLERGDTVNTVVNSDNGDKRLLCYYTFTGHLICPTN